jgi:hypothetical protein
MINLTPMHPSIQSYNATQTSTDQEICNLLASLIDAELKEAESKIWHGHPVWFINGNPIVGYSKEKRGIRLMFWSGADFEEDTLNILGGKFKDASIFYSQTSEIKPTVLKRWLKKSRTIQWDYQNIVKRKGVLVKLV